MAAVRIFNRPRIGHDARPGIGKAAGEDEEGAVGGAMHHAPCPNPGRVIISRAALISRQALARGPNIRRGPAFSLTSWLPSCFLTSTSRCLQPSSHGPFRPGVFRRRGLGRRL